MLWTTLGAVCAYFGGQTGATFTHWAEEGSDDEGIEVAVRIVFSESTLGYLQRVWGDGRNKYFERLEKIPGLFLRSPNREDDDSYLLARGLEDFYGVGGARAGGICRHGGPPFINGSGGTANIVV